MENLETALASKKLEDLQVVQETANTTLLEPTKAEIETIIIALKDGISYKDIKTTIRRTVGKGKQGFSYGQIKEIDLARQAKIAEITAPVEEIIKK